jgi:hypothetical protein
MFEFFILYWNIQAPDNTKQDTGDNTKVCFKNVGCEDGRQMEVVQNHVQC